MPNPILDSFSRVSRAQPCGICGKPDWCLTGKNGTNFEGATICTRIESPRRFHEAGWIHRAAGWNGRRQQERPRVLSLDRSTPGLAWAARIASAAEHALGADSRQSLASRLRVSPESLMQLGVGVVTPKLADEGGLPWTEGSWTFPMKNARGEVTGLRLRKRDGTKLTWPGSRDGLFLPAGPENLCELVLGEGATDTAAGIDLGLSIVGRPSCNGGRREVRELIRIRRPRRVVVVADRDVPGNRGARDLVQVLVGDVADLRLVEPPEPHKDLRAWLRAGATPGMARELIDESPPLRISIGRRSGGGPVHG